MLPFLRAGSDVWVMSTLAVGLLFIDLAELIWGRNPTPVPPSSAGPSARPGVHPAAACSSSSRPSASFFALDLFYRRTLRGKAFRAVAHSPDVSGLMGSIPAGCRRVLRSRCALAGIAGFLVVPLTLAEPQMGTVLGLKAFAIAIIAGLAAPRGILICGLLYGALEGLISGYLYTGIRDILGFSLMILALYAASPRDCSDGGGGAGMMRARHAPACSGSLALVALPSSSRAPTTSSSASSCSSTASSPSASTSLPAMPGSSRSAMPR